MRAHPNLVAKKRYVLLVVRNIQHDSLPDRQLAMNAPNQTVFVSGVGLMNVASVRFHFLVKLLNALYCRLYRQLSLR
jgi:hypothetical protein